MDYERTGSYPPEEKRPNSGKGLILLVVWKGEFPTHNLCGLVRLTGILAVPALLYVVVKPIPATLSRQRSRVRVPFEDSGQVVVPAIPAVKYNVPSVPHFSAAWESLVPFSILSADLARPTGPPRKKPLLEAI